MTNNTKDKDKKKYILPWERIGLIINNQSCPNPKKWSTQMFSPINLHLEKKQTKKNSCLPFPLSLFFFSPVFLSQPDTTDRTAEGWHGKNSYPFASFYLLSQGLISSFENE